MLDHAFVQAIAAMRDALDNALLQRSAAEERYMLDLVSGDTIWETTYTLPGEAAVPRVQAAITFEWSSWSQTAHRANVLGDEVPGDEPPDITVEIVFRIQRLADPPDVDAVAAALPEDGPVAAPFAMDRRPAAVEPQYDEPGSPATFAVEVPFDGVYDLPPEAKPKDDLSALGGWIASALVRDDLRGGQAPQPPAPLQVHPPRPPGQEARRIKVPGPGGVDHLVHRVGRHLHGLVPRRQHRPQRPPRHRGHPAQPPQ